ncbi:MAG TPA: M23 family metallopeptidase [Bacillota bacterium]|nr:M23 family metallopeptidase [Bacillota bacterium]
MQRQIKNVRRSIKQRRNIKHIRKKKHEHPLTTNFVDEHEKQGDVQLYPPHTLSSKGKQSFISFPLLKGILALFLFGSTFIMFKTNMLQAVAPKDWIEDQLTKEFPFATVNAWYYEKFGRPLAFNPQVNDVATDDSANTLPVLGKVSEPFHVNGQGIKISPTEVTPVKAWQDGIVIFSGNDRTTKKTVIIQHADQSETSYGYLSTNDVHLYQYVAAGQVIGMFHPGEEYRDIYFSIEKDDSYIDPIQVMQVDER